MADNQTPDKGNLTTQLDSKSNSPNNVEGTKSFVFNETGNVMVATTLSNSQQIEKDVRKVFNEVTVFFAAMSKAITTTPIPGRTDKQCYSIYNYDAIDRVISGSGLFVKVTQEDIHYTSSSFGINFSKELITALLGLPTGAGGLAFASALVASVGKEGIEIDVSNSRSEGKVAHIVFVCEYLMGMPLVTVLVVSVANSEVKTAVQAGPCIKFASTDVKLDMHKDSYLFVTPTFIKKYSKDLESVIKSRDYSEFVAYLKSLVTGAVTISQVINKDTKDVAKDIFQRNVSYIIQGFNLGDNPKVTLGADNGSNKLNVTDKTDETITFAGMASGSFPPAQSQPIFLYDASGVQLATSNSSYSMIGAITAFEDENSTPVPGNTALDKTKTYTIRGTGFGPKTTPGKMYFDAKEKGNEIAVVTWDDTIITFKAMKTPSHAPSTETQIYIYNAHDELINRTTDSFTMTS